MKYALIELPDNFEKGCCQDCPISYTEWFDDDGYTDCQDVCVLNSRYDECPLDIRAEKIPLEHKCHNCKHYLRGEYDGSCGSYICKNYSGWEQGGK